MECCAHHRNAQRAAVIPGDDADSDVGRVIGWGRQDRRGRGAHVCTQTNLL